MLKHLLRSCNPAEVEAMYTQNDPNEALRAVAASFLKAAVAITVILSMMSLTSCLVGGV